MAKESQKSGKENGRHNSTEAVPRNIPENTKVKNGKTTPQKPALAVKNQTNGRLQIKKASICLPTIERKELIQRRLQQRPRKQDLSCHWLVTGVSSDKR